MPACLSVVLVTGLLAGCDDPAPRTVAITTHALPGDCALPVAENAELVLQPFGDFVAPTPLLLPLSARAPDALPIPDATRAVAAEVGAGAEQFVGYAERTATGALPILLWPASRACRLADGALEYPAPGGGQGLGYDAASRQVLLAGGDDPNQSSKSFEMLGFDAGTGAASPGLVLEEPREFATVTAFGGRLLVAGGEDPLNTEDSVVASSRKAWVIDPAAVASRVAEIELRVPRTRHAATVLPNGDTLLVGGRGPFGDALNLLEAVSPDRASTDAAFPALQAPRFFPTVLALDDGRLFIGGGTAADQSPLSALEWLSRDARRRLAVEVPEELPARHDRAFAAMPGGGVLVVGGCAPRAPRPGEDCSACRNGCPPSDDAGARYDAWWLLPNGSLRPLALPVEAPRPVLLGELGRALLSPGSGASDLYRFDPWGARFVPADDVMVPCPPRAGLPVVPLDEEAFVWVTDSGACEGAPALFGMRVGTRNRYASRLDWVPDRPPLEGAGYGEDELWFAAASDVRVYVAGSDYADFTLRFAVPEGSAMPRLLLTSDERVGPLVIELPASPDVTIERSGTELRTGSSRVSVPGGRVRVGFAAGDEETRLLGIRLER